MDRKEQAIEYFKEGYNCSQSVVLAFEDLLSVDKETLMKLSSSFGGGIGRLREVCGCVSGMSIVLGLLYGFESPKPGQAKKDHYALIQKLAGEFEEKCGSIVCRDLLELSQKHDLPEPEPRTEHYYKKRPCAELTGIAAEILDKYISGKSAE